MEFEKVDKIESDSVYDNELSQELKKIESNFKFSESVKKLSPTFQTDRLVFGKFKKDGSTLKIVKPTWLSQDSLNKSEVFKSKNSFSKSESNKSTVSFNFTKGLKDIITDPLDWLCIDDYDDKNKKVILISNNSEKEYQIPSSWIEQRNKTQQLTGYKIKSKIVFPIMLKNKDGSNFFWGVAFLESTQSNLRKTFSVYDIQFFHMLIKRFGSLLIENEQNQMIKNKSIDNKFSFITLLLGLVSAEMGWFFSNPIGYIVGAGLISLSAIHYYSMKRHA